MATVALRAPPELAGDGVLGIVLAVSRIYAGLHYPTDVVSGWA